MSGGETPRILNADKITRRTRVLSLIHLPVYCLGRVCVSHWLSTCGKEKIL